MAMARSRCGLGLGCARLEASGRTRARCSVRCRGGPRALLAATSCSVHGVHGCGEVERLGSHRMRKRQRKASPKAGSLARGGVRAVVPAMVLHSRDRGMLARHRQGGSAEASYGCTRASGSCKNIGWGLLWLRYRGVIGTDIAHR